MKIKKLINLISIPLIKDDCSLCFAQKNDHIPFDIKRVYYILKSKPGISRGLHAHKKLQQVFFCIQGSMKMVLDDGKKRKEVFLNKPNRGILLEPMVWHEMKQIKKDTIMLVLASDVYKESDYIRDYEEFKKLTNNE
jgi:dTDP-4-dehydrorhamnose 3,5-epimerase-like enzyme